jgi:hypothetical protein
MRLISSDISDPFARAGVAGGDERILQPTDSTHFGDHHIARREEAPLGQVPITSSIVGRPSSGMT